jgi:hypothetical protein
MKFFGTIGDSNTKHLYEAIVEVNGEPGEIEIQANSSGEASQVAKDAGYVFSRVYLTA